MNTILLLTNTASTECAAQAYNHAVGVHAKTMVIDHSWKHAKRYTVPLLQQGLLNMDSVSCVFACFCKLCICQRRLGSSVPIIELVYICV